MDTKWATTEFCQQTHFQHTTTTQLDTAAVDQIPCFIFFSRILNIEVQKLV